MWSKTWDYQTQEQVYFKTMPTMLVGSSTILLLNDDTDVCLKHWFISNADLIWFRISISYTLFIYCIIFKGICSGVKVI